jgi:hypothetical protein
MKKTTDRRDIIIANPESLRPIPQSYLREDY